MDFDEVVKKRKMIREYGMDRQQIANETITKLIINAHKAPSVERNKVRAGSSGW